MVKMRLLFFISGLVLVLTSCSYISTPSYFKSRSNQYLAARNNPPLRMPPGVTSDAFNNDYPIPMRAYSYSNKDINIEPPGLRN